MSEDLNASVQDSSVSVCVLVRTWQGLVLPPFTGKTRTTVTSDSANAPSEPDGTTDSSPIYKDLSLVVKKTN